MDKKDITFFKRFLKDKGLYSAFKRGNNISRSTYPNIQSFQNFIKNHLDPCEILMFCVTWDYVRQKTGFYWGDIYTEFKKYYKKNIESYKRKK